MYTLKSQLCAVAYTCAFHRPTATKRQLTIFGSKQSYLDINENQI